MKLFPFLPCRSLFALLSMILVLVVSSPAQNTNVAAAQRHEGKTASVVIVVDTSKAARGSIDTLRNGAKTLASRFSSNDELALFFSGEKPVLVQDFTGDTALINNSLRRIRTNGRLALFETLSQALDHARSDAANEQRAVIAFVNDLDGAIGPGAAALENAIRNKPGVPIYLVALKQTSWSAQEEAQKIAVLSGGTAFFPQKSSEVGSIARTLAMRLGGQAANDVEIASAQSLSNYKTVVVRGIPVADNGSTGQFAQADSELLHRLLMSRLERAKLFGEVRDGASAVETSGDSAGQAGTELELLPMVLAFHQPSSNQRHFLSPFAGGSRLKVQVVLRDAATHEPIGAFVEEASASQGWFSGSDERNQAEAMMSVVNKIVTRVRDMKKTGKKR